MHHPHQVSGNVRPLAQSLGHVHDRRVAPDHAGRVPEVQQGLPGFNVLQLPPAPGAVTAVDPETVFEHHQYQRQQGLGQPRAFRFPVGIPAIAGQAGQHPGRTGRGQGGGAHQDPARRLKVPVLLEIGVHLRRQFPRHQVHHRALRRPVHVDEPDIDIVMSQLCHVRLDFAFRIDDERATDRLVSRRHDGADDRQYPGQRLAAAGLAQHQGMPAQGAARHLAVRPVQRRPLGDGEDISRDHGLRCARGKLRDEVHQPQRERQRRGDGRVHLEQLPVQLRQRRVVFVLEARRHVPAQLRQQLPAVGFFARGQGVRGAGPDKQVHDGAPVAPREILEPRGRARGAAVSRPAHQPVNEPPIDFVRVFQELLGRLDGNDLLAQRPSLVVEERGIERSLPVVAAGHQVRRRAGAVQHRASGEPHSSLVAQVVHRRDEVRQRRDLPARRANFHLDVCIVELKVQLFKDRDQGQGHLLLDDSAHLDHGAVRSVFDVDDIYHYGLLQVQVGEGQTPCPPRRSQWQRSGKGYKNKKNARTNRRTAYLPR